MNEVISAKLKTIQQYQILIFSTSS